VGFIEYKLLVPFINNQVCHFHTPLYENGK